MAGAFLVDTGPDRGPDRGSGRGSPPTLVPPRTTPAAVTVTTVTGTVTLVDAAGAEAPALTTPLEITVPARGQGSATFFDVDVGGRPSTIAWQAGEPLGLIGHGAILPGRADVVVDTGGATWSLDGARRALAPGSYRAAAPVAVGQSGLAQAENGADFTAGAGSVVETSGGATVHRPPSALHLAGSGPLSLAGSLEVGAGAGARSARSLRLSGGSYVVDLTPQGGRLTVRATLSGPVAVTAG